MQAVSEVPRSLVFVLSELLVWKIMTFYIQVLSNHKSMLTKIPILSKDLPKLKYEFVLMRVKYTTYLLLK